MAFGSHNMEDLEQQWNEFHIEDEERLREGCYFMNQRGYKMK